MIVYNKITDLIMKMALVGRHYTQQSISCGDRSRLRWETQNKKRRVVVWSYLFFAYIFYLYFVSRIYV